MKQLSLEHLRNICQSVQKRRPFLAVLAIPWMHFTNTRDATQNQLCRGENVGTFWHIPPRILWIFFVALSNAWKAVWFRSLYRKPLKTLCHSPIDVVARTWGFWPRRGDSRFDFYLGDLQGQLESQGLKTLLLYGNVGNRRWRLFCKEYFSKEKPYQYPDFCLLKWYHFFGMALRQIVICFVLLYDFFRTGDEESRLVTKQSVVDCLKRQTFRNGMHFWIGREIVKQWHPKAVITLFEGYSWEKCFWQGIKAEDSFCKTIGYQHTVILQRTLEFREPCLNHEESSTLDIILCSGYKVTDILEKSHENRKTRIIPFGSFRYQPSLYIKQPSNPARRTVLVVSDYFMEAPFLFNTAMKIASILRDHHFILRLHPIDPFSRVKPYLNVKVENFPNIEISKQGKIEEDFARSSAILYRGSSAVLYAILNGLKPFYLHRRGMEVIDPIFELSEWRQNVESEDALEQGLLEYAKTTTENNLPKWKVARDHVQAYTMPVNQNSIDRLLMSI